ncbi:MAG: metallophosphoesterase [Ferruginibacter sp.]
MKYFTSLLMAFAFTLLILTARADVVIFPFGTNNAATTNTWSYIGGGTNLDAVPTWKLNGYNEATLGWLTNRKAALGFGTNPPVRNTAIPENTTIGGGGAAGARYNTMYFRKVVNIASPGAYINFLMRAQFDDGIVVWVNGVEAYRGNMNTGTVNYITLAPAAIANNGADIYSQTISTGLFIPGNNVIAVEVHQNAVSSSDLFMDMELTGVTAASLTRGPYLQMGNETGITLRWRTGTPTDSRVTWGTANGVYPNTIDSATVTTEHTVRISGLTADSKYFYTIGSTAGVLQSGAGNYFLTSPLNGSTRKLRIWAIGDCGNASTNQVDTKNAFVNYIGSNEVDALISLGDNAYLSGTDGEFQAEFFDIYKDDILKKYKLYTAPGNHDYGNNTANTGVRNNAYYNSFELPSAGQCGGVPSNKEAYYSFDVGNIHFLSLDSYGKENGNTTSVYDTLGEQAVWVKADLAANTKRWVVAYFHHPPYTMTSHNSNTETSDLGRMREEFIRILERNGVDMVLCGHSHGYERSYLLKNYYKQTPAGASLMEADFVIANHTATGNTQNAMYNGSASSCPYTYNSGKYNHGSMYVVAGSSGQIGGGQAGPNGTYPHSAMFYSNNTQGGSFYFEVDSNRFDAKFISYSGTGGSVVPVERDRFTIFKDVKKKQTLNVIQNVPAVLKASWRGGYYWPNNAGATTQAVTISNSAIGTFRYIVRDSAVNICIADTFDVVVSVGTLPVVITSFTATLNQNKVSLDWATSQEINNSHFTLERSGDGVNFNFLAKVYGIGNSNTATNYKFIDGAPVNGVNYYRLSQTNIDGATKYFDIKTVTYRSNKDFYSAIYNTGKNKVNVNITSSKSDNIAMQVIDMQGKTVMQFNIAVQNGSAVKQLTIVPSGIYLIKLVNTKGVTITNKIIVE